MRPPLQLQNQFYFFNLALRVFSQKKDIKYIRGDFYQVAWVMPLRWDLRVMGVKSLIL